MKIPFQIMDFDSSYADNIAYEVMISLAVLSNEMNVPIAAIRAIARTENVNIDSQSECISEDSLGVYADAYIRKLKAYFRRMTRNEQLRPDPEEAIAFDKFCNSFKKSTQNESNVRSWDDIDEDAIREHFCEKVLEKASPKTHDINLSELHFDFSKSIVINSEVFLSHFSLVDESLYYDDYQIKPLPLDLEFQRKTDILTKVIHSSQYFQNKVTRPVLFLHRRLNSVRLIPIVARYQVYPNNDDDNNLLAA